MTALLTLPHTLLLPHDAMAVLTVHLSALLLKRLVCSVQYWQQHAPLAFAACYISENMRTFAGPKRVGNCSAQ
jgi:hypothetical protein